MTLEEHIKENKESFAKIDELLILNGDHMSHFRKDIIETKNDISEIKDMLRKQNESYRVHNESIKAHMDRVEPMLSSYEKDNAVSLYLGEKGKKWGKRIVIFASIISALYIIKEFVISILLKIK